MQYDFKKDIEKEAKVKLEWHGEDTKVLIKGDATKTEVKKGDVIEVTIQQAKELFSYSQLWTLEGDKPVKHGFDEMVAKLNKAAEKKAAKKTKADDGVEGDEKEKEIDLLSLDINNMEKPELISTLKKLKVTFNSNAGKEKLAELLKEVVAEKKAAADEKETEEKEK